MREVSGSGAKIGLGLSGEYPSKSSNLRVLGRQGSLGAQSSLQMRRSNDNTFGSGGLLNRQSSGDNQSSEILELPLKRPKNLTLQKLDNPSTAKLRR